MTSCTGSECYMLHLCFVYYQTILIHEVIKDYNDDKTDIDDDYGDNNDDDSDSDDN